MIHQYDIRGTAELYTIAVNSCSHHGGWEFACSVYDDMIRKGVAPDEVDLLNSMIFTYEKSLLISILVFRSTVLFNDVNVASDANKSQSPPASCKLFVCVFS